MTRCCVFPWIKNGNWLRGAMSESWLMRGKNIKKQEYPVVEKHFPREKRDSRAIRSTYLLDAFPRERGRSIGFQEEFAVAITARAVIILHEDEPRLLRTTRIGDLSSRTIEWRTTCFGLNKKCDNAIVGRGKYRRKRKTQSGHRRSSPRVPPFASLFTILFVILWWTRERERESTHGVVRGNFLSAF